MSCLPGHLLLLYVPAAIDLVPESSLLWESVLPGKTFITIFDPIPERRPGKQKKQLVQPFLQIFVRRCPNAGPAVLDMRPLRQ